MQREGDATPSRHPLALEVIAMPEKLPPEVMQRLFGESVDLDMTELISLDFYPPDGAALRFRIPDGQELVVRIRAKDVSTLADMFAIVNERLQGPKA